MLLFKFYMHVNLFRKLLKSIDFHQFFLHTCLFSEVKRTTFFRKEKHWCSYVYLSVQISRFYFPMTRYEYYTCLNHIYIYIYLFVTVQISKLIVTCNWILSSKFKMYWLKSHNSSQKFCYIIKKIHFKYSFLNGRFFFRILICRGGWVKELNFRYHNVRKRPSCLAFVMYNRNNLSYWKWI